MNYGTIKNIGNGKVDVQLTGSAGVVRNVRISAQVDWSTLAPGARVLVETVEGLPVVLHTITDIPSVYTTEENTYAGSGATSIVNLGGVLMADGSIPLTGNLAVTPGITIDGYDISTLGQTIDNLQAADSVARTGYTVMTHASHIVESFTATATQILIRHNLFTDKETLTVSNTAGEIENMKVVGSPVATVDSRGAICYRYTVTRRTSTSPAGLYTGWAAATLVNGLTHRGYIAFDARESRPATPSMRFVLHTDIDAGTTEHIVRTGSLNGILDYTDEDYGFAVGRLTTADKFLAYSYADNRFRIRGADFSGEDETGAEAFRIWGIAEGGRVPGDFRFGPELGGHQEWTSESQRLSIFNGANEVIYFSPTESRFKNMVWAGKEAGPQIGIGEMDGEGTIIARNSLDVAQFVVRTRANSDGVYIFGGNPKPQGNWFEFDNGLTVDGLIRARALEIIGQASMNDTGEIIIRDPNDPRRYGHIKPHHWAGYSVDSTNTQYMSMLFAWAPTTLEVVPGSNQWRTWIAGESFQGDWRYNHWRVERNGRVGLFNGDTPKAYLDINGNAVLDGKLIWADGYGVADDTGIRVAASPAADPTIEHRYNIVSENNIETLSFMGGYYTPGNTTSDLNILWLEADSSTTNRKAAATLRGRASSGKASANIGALRGAAYATVDVSVDTSGLALTFIDSNDINLHCDKLGTYGVPPVARQLLATGAGHTVDDVITFLQNLGLARQV